MYKLLKSNNLLTPTKFGLRKYLYSFVVFRFLLFVLYSFQYTDLSNPLLRSFDSFWLSFADKVTTGKYNFVSLIVKIISELGSLTSLPPLTKTCFAHLSVKLI